MSLFKAAKGSINNINGLIKQILEGINFYIKQDNTSRS